MPGPAASDLSASLRHAIALCAVAGYVDAFGYFDLAHVFAANMSGNTVFLGTGLVAGLAVGNWDRAATNAFTISVFFLGAILASLLRRVSGRSYLGLLLAAGLLMPTHLIALTTKEQSFLLGVWSRDDGADAAPAALGLCLVAGVALVAHHHDTGLNT